MMKSVNLIVATVQNNAAMNMSVRKAATQLIQGGRISDGLLDQVEMAFRAYDPCLACASHALPGRMPIRVYIHQTGKPTECLTRNRD
jgi:F420-non-reducing hydrogenase large subunit